MIKKAKALQTIKPKTRQNKTVKEIAQETTSPKVSKKITTK
jgi:hypothetical protein